MLAGMNNGGAGDFVADHLGGHLLPLGDRTPSLGLRSLTRVVDLACGSDRSDGSPPFLSHLKATSIQSRSSDPLLMSPSYRGCNR